MKNQLSHQGWSFEGISEGGVRTSLACHNLNVLMDMGGYIGNFAHFNHVLLSHAHLDHSAGIPYFISQRSLRKLGPPNIYIPPDNLAPLQEILKLYAQMEDFDYKYNLIAVEKDKYYPINNQFGFKALPSYHRVSSYGYTIFHTKQKLKEQYQNLEKQEILHLKNNGTTITETIQTPIFSFSGDTKIEYVLDHEPVRKSQILFLECTYIDDKKNVEHTRKWGHTHWHEILEHAQEFENEKIVLIHFSKRYSNRMIQEKIARETPDILKDRIHYFLPNHFS